MANHRFVVEYTPQRRFLRDLGGTEMLVERERAKEDRGDISGFRASLTTSIMLASWS